MVKISVVFLMIVGLTSAGCINNPKNSIAGTYTNENNSKSYMILYEDGTFNAFYSDGSSDSGAYRLVENQLIMTYAPFGNVLVWNKNGTAWENERGKYVKTK